MQARAEELGKNQKIQNLLHYSQSGSGHYYFLKYFIYLFLERGEGETKRGRERTI